MIRPFTAVTFALAAGMVLYTYQAKHQVQLLDRDIEKTLIDTVSLREQSRTLKAEWTLRENPDRLKAFADQYLTLKPLAPTQFTTLAELDSRLPAPIVGAPATDPNDTTEEPELPVAEAASPMTDLAATDDLPIPPLPVPPPAAVVATLVPAAPASVAAPPPAARRVAQPAPVPTPAPPPVAMVAVDRTVPAPKPAPPRPSVLSATAALPAPTPQPRPPLQVQAPTQSVQTQPLQTQPSQTASYQAQPVRSAPVQTPPLQARAQPAAMPQPQFAPQPAPQAASQPPMGGSLLGIAHGGSFAPSPRPMPVATTQWSNGN